MIYIELPLWLAILFAIAFSLVLLHLLFGDFIAKLLIRYFKGKGENEDE
ncbi:MAG: hypothetical protein K5765_06750 [Clostridia bacterium]|nr:hypothetical protein [Clostridia bacterium]